MQATGERLSPLDATFLELEQADEGALMHTGGALIFDPTPAHGATPSLEQVRALLETRLGLLPRFRSRLSEPRVHGLRRPAWIPDQRFDLAAHIQHATLPPPGKDAELHAWLGDFWSHRLDRARPLWEIFLVEGLERGRWMLATKTHHAMVDGVASIDVGHILLDSERHPDTRPVPKPQQPRATAGDGLRLPGWLSPAIDAAQVAVGAARHPRRLDRKSTRLNSSHCLVSRMPSSA